MFISFSIVNWVKCPMKIHEKVFAPYIVWIWPSYQNFTSWPVIHIFQYPSLHNHSKCSLSSFIYIINRNKQFWSHMWIFIIHSFRQNSQDIYFRAITHPTSKCLQLFWSKYTYLIPKMNLTQACLWNPRLDPCLIYSHIILN